MNIRLPFLIYFLSSVLSLMAQSEYVEVTIPVRDAVTRTSLNNDRHRVKFEICSVADSTAITESLPVFSLGEDPSAMSPTSFPLTLCSTSAGTSTNNPRDDYEKNSVNVAANDVRCSSLL